MKKLLTIVLALTALNAMAVNVRGNWFTAGEKLKFIQKVTNMGGTYATQDEAVEAAFAYATELQSGDPSDAAIRKMERSHTIQSDDSNCERLVAKAKIVVIGEMAKGKFLVKKVNFGSHINGAGEQQFTSSITYYAPCLIDRD